MVADPSPANSTTDIDAHPFGYSDQSIYGQANLYLFLVVKAREGASSLGKVQPFDMHGKF